MFRKLLFVALLPAALSFYSCGSKKENNPAIKTDSTAVKTDPDSEIASLENSLKQDSLNLKTRLMLASRYYGKGDLQKALDNYGLVYMKDPTNLVALTNMGNIFYDTHQDDRAIEFYEKAVEIDSLNIDIRCDLATSYSNVNRMKKAIQILKKNIEMNPQHLKSHYNLSVILKRSGDTKGADAEMKIYRSLADKK